MPLKIRASRPSQTETSNLKKKNWPGMLCSLFFCRESHLLLVSGIVNGIQQLFFFFSENQLLTTFFFGPTTLKPKWLGRFLKLYSTPIWATSPVCCRARYNSYPRPPSCVPPRFLWPVRPFGPLGPPQKIEKLFSPSFSIAMPAHSSPAWRCCCWLNPWMLPWTASPRLDLRVR